MPCALAKLDSLSIGIPNRSFGILYTIPRCFLFLNRTRIYEDVIQIYMDELTDAITKDSGYQLLKHRGCVSVTHLHYLPPECAKYCSECHLMDVFLYNVYLFIHFRHIEL